MFHSKSIKSVFTVLLALLGITFFANQSVKADEYADSPEQTTIAPNPYSQEQVDKIANTLKFYLEDVGYFDTQKGKYIVKDFASLREKAITKSEEQEFARIFAKLNAISIVGSIALNAISCWGY